MRQSLRIRRAASLTLHHQCKRIYCWIVVYNSTTNSKIYTPHFVSIFFLPSCFLGNSKQVGGRWKSLLNGGLVSHPDGSQVYFALVLHLIMEASVTGFSSGGRRRKMRHGPWAKQTKCSLSTASALSYTPQNHPLFFINVWTVRRLCNILFF